MSRSTAGIYGFAVSASRSGGKQAGQGRVPIGIWDGRVDGWGGRVGTGALNLVVWASGIGVCGRGRGRMVMVRKSDSACYVTFLIWIDSSFSVRSRFFVDQPIDGERVDFMDG